MSKFEVFDRCDANAIRHDVARLAKRLRAARVAARALKKDLDWFVSDARTLQEHTERLWRKNANLTRAYPADLRLPAKKEILTDLGLWEPIGQASAEEHGR